VFPALIVYVYLRQDTEGRWVYILYIVDDDWGIKCARRFYERRHTAAALLERGTEGRGSCTRKIYQGPIRLGEGR
jgi:hypothetical protein